MSPNNPQQTIYMKKYISQTGIAFAQLHVSILLAGFTGILGKLISGSEGMLVWYRMAMTFVLLWIFLYATGKLEKVSLKDVGKISVSGVLLCLHWLFFYGSIKLSNVSIGVICFSLLGFFTVFLEPFVMGTRFSWREMAYSILSVAGVCCVFSFDARYRLGIIVGVIAALLCALYVLSMKRLCDTYKAHTTLLWQMGGGVAFLSLIAPFYISYFQITYLIPTWEDTLLLLCLSVVCTIGMNLLLIESLHTISAFTVNLSFNLEPVYSIVIAILFMGEGSELNFSFYFGLSIIMLSVGLQSLWVVQQKGVPS